MMRDLISLKDQEGEGFLVLVKGLVDNTDRPCNLKQVWFFFQYLSDNRIAKANFSPFFSSQQDDRSLGEELPS